ncbi:MAG: hypothetical protein AAGD34_00955 [Pseudomonadota bacterium]
MNRDEFVEALKAQIDEWNADIAKMEAQMKTASGDLERRYAEGVAEASRHRADAQAKLAESLKHTTDSWERARSDMEGAWKDVSEGFMKAWRRFE